MSHTGFDFSQHQADVIFNDGTNRLIRCHANHRLVNSFQVTTYEGYLAFTGDRGSFVLHRPDTDMLHFVAGNCNSPSYIADKLRGNPDREWCSNTAREWLKEGILDNLLEDLGIPVDEKDELAEEMLEQLCFADAYTLAGTFDGFCFEDCGNEIDLDFNGLLQSFSEYDYSPYDFAVYIGQSQGSRFLWMIDAVEWVASEVGA